jgi:hypothetical protein
MRIHSIAIVTVFLMATTAAIAQNSGGSSAPLEEGNRANGFDYQPTSSEVVPREKAAGILPPAAQQKTTDHTLEQMDKNLLRDEGLSTKSTPNMTTNTQNR